MGYPVTDLKVVVRVVGQSMHEPDAVRSHHSERLDEIGARDQRQPKDYCRALEDRKGIALRVLHRGGARCALAQQRFHRAANQPARLSCLIGRIPQTVPFADATATTPPAYKEGLEPALPCHRSPHDCRSDVRLIGCDLGG